jgi:hypothetical protein
MRARPSTRRLLVLAGAAALFGAAALAEVGIPPIPQERLIDERIAVAAQRALRSLSEREGEDRGRAWKIYKAVRSGALGGIYQVDMGVPALRVRKGGGNWWEVLGGETAKCLLEPAGEPPLLVYSEKVGNDWRQLVDALPAAFEGCGFAELRVNVVQQSDPPPCPGEDTVTVKNASLGIETDPCVTAEGSCRFMLPRDQSYDVTVDCAGERHDRSVSIPADEAEVEISFEL